MQFLTCTLENGESKCDKKMFIKNVIWKCDKIMYIKNVTKNILST